MTREENVDRSDTEIKMYLSVIATMTMIFSFTYDPHPPVLNYLWCNTNLRIEPL